MNYPFVKSVCADCTRWIVPAVAAELGIEEAHRDLYRAGRAVDDAGAASARARHTGGGSGTISDGWHGRRPEPVQAGSGESHFYFDGWLLPGSAESAESLGGAQCGRDSAATSESSQRAHAAARAAGICTGRIFAAVGALCRTEQSVSARPQPAWQSHWPILRIVVLHDIETGMAQQPCWGAMFGPEAVSEQALGERALDPLPPGAVIIGDRNFGIFAIAYAAHQEGIG